MMFTLRHWTTLSYRRALLSLVISLAVAWVIALRLHRRGGPAGRRVPADLEVRRPPDHLHRAPADPGGDGPGRRPVHLGRAARRLRHRPWLLIFLIFVQATVYLCAPDRGGVEPAGAGVPGQERRRGFAERRLRAERRRRARALVPRPAAAALTALCVGGVTSAFVAPVSLLHTTTRAREEPCPRSRCWPPRAPRSTLSWAPSPPGRRTYYPVTSVHLSDHRLAGRRRRSGSASTRPRWCCSARSSGRPRTAGGSRTSASPSARRAWTAGRRPSSWTRSLRPPSRLSPGTSVRHARGQRLAPASRGQRRRPAAGRRCSAPGPFAACPARRPLRRT